MSRPRYYRLNPDHSVTPLDQGGPFALDALTAWAIQFGSSDRRVAWTSVAPGVEVSTVFLGLDHRFGGDGPPIVFETMVFDDYGGGDTRRYCTWADALDGHNEMVAELTAKLQTVAEFPQMRKNERGPVGPAFEAIEKATGATVACQSFQRRRGSNEWAVVVRVTRRDGSRRDLYDSVFRGLYTAKL